MTNIVGVCNRRQGQELSSYSKKKVLISTESFICKDKSRIWLHNIDTPFSALSNIPFPDNDEQNNKNAKSCLDVAESQTDNKNFWGFVKITQFISRKLSSNKNVNSKTISDDILKAIRHNNPKNLTVKVKRNQSILINKIESPVSSTKRLLKKGKWAKNLK